MLIPSSQSSDHLDDERPVAGTSSGTGNEKEETGAVYTCKFPGCTRQYASTDGVRKHCRKSHAEWLKEVDLEKASLGCRWAAYCTRQVIEEGAEDPRTTPVGSKRAREIMAIGNAQYDGTFRTAGLQKTASASTESSAFGGGGTLVPPRPERQPSENNVPPDMVVVPNDLSTPLPAADPKLTPNAQARQRLGEIADHEGCPSVPSATGFFAWGMPPLKRGLSLADTREPLVLASGGSSVLQEVNDDADSQAPPSRNESFLDSIIA